MLAYGSSENYQPSLAYLLNSTMNGFRLTSSTPFEAVVVFVLDTCTEQ